MERCAAIFREESAAAASGGAQIVASSAAQSEGHSNGQTPHALVRTCQRSKLWWQGALGRCGLTRVDDVILERQQHSPQTSGEVLDEVHEEHVSDVLFEVRDPIALSEV